MKGHVTDVVFGVAFECRVGFRRVSVEQSES